VTRLPVCVCERSIVNKKASVVSGEKKGKERKSEQTGERKKRLRTKKAAHKANAENVNKLCER